MFGMSVEDLISFQFSTANLSAELNYNLHTVRSIKQYNQSYALQVVLRLNDIHLTINLNVSDLNINFVINCRMLI